MKWLRFLLVAFLFVSCDRNPVNNDTYTVTYDGNGATGGAVPAAQTKIHGVALTLAANSGNLVRTGHTFAGWNTAADGNGMNYAEGASYTANDAVTLYAMWTIGGNTLTDIDGNVYKTVRIGNQEWMAENLRVTRYNDGTAIPHVTDSAQWVNRTTPGYCYYDNATDADTIKKWGALYNWYVVSPMNPKPIAPAGWRVPMVEDWDTLKTYLIVNGYNWDGTTSGNKIAKSMAAKTDWSQNDNEGTPGNNPSSNNRSGFSALPGGYRSNDGSFSFQSNYGFWWSATVYVFGASYAWYRSLYCFAKALDSYYLNRDYGFSVRLLRDVDY